MRQLNLLDELAGYDPVVIGTPPLGLDVADSDIDVACSAADLDEFERHVTQRLSLFECFRAERLRVREELTVLVGFRAHDWDFELFCQRLPTAQQWGVRHFSVERRLLELLPGLRARVRALRREGLKTEPAFAQALGLLGDPYEAVAQLAERSDEWLLERFS